MLRALLALAVTLAAAPAHATVAMSFSCPGSVVAGTQFDATLNIDSDSDPLGAYSTTVTWNPTKVALISVGGGSATGFAAAPFFNTTCATQTACSTRIAAFQVADLAGPTEVSPVATLRFQGVSAGTGIAITPTVPKLFDTDAAAIALASGTACTLTVTCKNRGQSCSQDSECCQGRCRGSGKCH